MIAVAALVGGAATATAQTTTPDAFVGITPVRVADTRASGAPIATGTSHCFAVAGVSGIPANATAVALNMTAVGYGVNGWLTGYPNGQAVPATSTLNYDPSAYAIANGVILAVGTGGQVCVNVGTVNSAPGSSHVVLDVTGYYLPAPAAPEYGLVSVFVNRGSGVTRWATFSGPLGSPAGTTLGGDFRFSCTPAQAPCKISIGAAVLSDQSGTTMVHPRLLINKQDGPSAPITDCEYADGANNNAGLDTISRVPTLVAAEAAMNTPLSMGIGSTLDCGSTQPFSPTVTEIWVPAASNGVSTAYYDVAATFAFSPGADFQLPPGP
jgi:hypothetical protein